MIPSGVTWPDVAGALVLAIPSIIAALLSNGNRRNLRTPNGKTVGDLVADIHSKESKAAIEYEPEVAPEAAP